MRSPSVGVFLLRLLVLLAGLVGPRAARAETPEQQAEALAARAVIMARAGDLTTAVELFEAAYALDPAPILLYNVGRVKARLGDTAGARRSLEQYVTLETDPQARARGQQALDEVLAALPREPAPEFATSPVVRPPAPAEPPHADLPPLQAARTAPVDRTWTWVWVGTGSALLVAGAVTAAVLLATRGSASAPDGVLTIGEPRPIEAAR